MWVYTTILHSVKKQFGLTELDYCIIDTIARLSAGGTATHKGWCNASNKFISDALYTSPKNIISVTKKAIQKGLLEVMDMGAGNVPLKRATEKWHNAVNLAQDLTPKVTGEVTPKVTPPNTKGNTPLLPKVSPPVTNGNSIDNNSDKNIDNEIKESSDLKKSPSPALKFLDLFTDSILYLNEKTGRKFEISEQDKKGKTDKFKLVCKVFASGYTLEEVKKVIDAKVGEWLHDSKMVKHLTYSTLFAARNFEKYIEEIKAGETKSDKVAPKNDLIGSIRPQIEEMGYKCQKGTIERIYGELKAKMSSGSTDTEICQKVLAFLSNAESRKYTDLNTILSNFNTILETIKKQKQHGTTK